MSTSVSPHEVRTWVLSKALPPHLVHMAQHFTSDQRVVRQCGACLDPLFLPSSFVGMQDTTRSLYNRNVSSSTLLADATPEALPDPVRLDGDIISFRRWPLALADLFFPGCAVIQYAAQTLCDCCLLFPDALSHELPLSSDGSCQLAPLWRSGG